MTHEGPEVCFAWVVTWLVCNLCVGVSLCACACVEGHWQHLEGKVLPYMWWHVFISVWHDSFYLWVCLCSCACVEGHWQHLEVEESPFMWWHVSISVWHDSFWIDWFWLRCWLINKGAICTRTAPLFWNFISLFQGPRTRLVRKIGSQNQSIFVQSVLVCVSVCSGTLAPFSSRRIALHVMTCIHICVTWLVFKFDAECVCMRARVFRDIGNIWRAKYYLWSSRSNNLPRYTHWVRENNWHTHWVREIWMTHSLNSRDASDSLSLWDMIRVLPVVFSLKHSPGTLIKFVKCKWLICKMQMTRDSLSSWDMNRVLPVVFSLKHSPGTLNEFVQCKLLTHWIPEMPVTSDLFK